MAETTRNIDGPPKIEFYNYAGNKSALTFDITHASQLSYGDGKLTITAAVDWSLLSFLKQSGIIFKDAFAQRWSTIYVIPGWHIYDTEGNKITRSANNRYTTISFNILTDKEGYIWRTVLVPKKFTTSTYKLYIYAATSGTTNFHGYASYANGIDSDVVALAWTPLETANVAVPVEIATSSQRTSSATLDIMVGKHVGTADTLAVKTISCVCLFALPASITCTADHVPYFPHLGSDDASKEGLMITVPFTDGATSDDYVFRGCSFTGDESWGVGEDITMNMTFTYKSVSFKE